MVAKYRKVTLHTDTVNKAVKTHERNVVLDGCPQPISNSEKDVTRKEHSTLSTKIWILWTHIRAESCRIQVSMSVQTAAQHT